MTPSTTGPTLTGVHLDNVDVVLSGTTIVNGATVVAEPGRITGIVGPNGSGKSTLLRTIYRDLRPHAGRVLVGDRDIRSLGAAEAARLVAAVPQERGTEFEFTTGDVVALGRIPHQGRFGGASTTDADAVRRAIADVGLAGFEDRTFAHLSGGEKQRALLARCFAQGGEVLVLDEPTNHLDINHQVQLLRILRSRAATTVITLHDLNAAAAACDTLFVVHDGRIVAHGAPGDVLTVDLLDAVFGVAATVSTDPRSGRPIIAVDYLAGPHD
ncbi:ABC transporter ATP-binding protein [Tsukamurella spumae]|uniref:ABC transporter ATP-binding protein n=1 Tax=Tsukamurella spumae TaxID=44753 RepID=A0A846WWW2_9ACTN|nr:ABC transporter ATP-binding protein [Tsukamurella spumae]NKY17648.1 ABC transporter ATP-binding protein [Tsukamurella spumae]